MRTKNKRDLLFLVLAGLLFLAAIILPQPLSAAGNHMVDDAGILSSSDASKVAQKLDEVSSKYNVDVVVYTVKNLNGETPLAAADDFYDYNGYSENGIVFLISMETREWAISTKGTCIRAFTDAGQSWLMDQIKPYMSDNNYYDAFRTFADYAGDYMKQYEKGKPYDSGNLPKKPFKALRDGIISILAGLGVGFGRASMLKAQTKTVKAATNASGYLKDANILGGSERMIHREFRRIERSSSGGGGSSTHISSSGSTHGGSSGTF
ncbi:MAG: TPM domain-containing protein [Eubacterium sp.]|nr:TPM domain-containing protein [Eubacterium sp.]